MPCLNNTAYIASQRDASAFVLYTNYYSDEMKTSLLIDALNILCTERDNSSFPRFFFFVDCFESRKKKHEQHTDEWYWKKSRHRKRRNNYEKNNKNQKEKTQEKNVHAKVFISMQQSYTNLSSSCHNSISNPWIYLPSA